MHPGTFDSGLYPLLALMVAGKPDAKQAAYIPVQFGRVSYLGGVPAHVAARIERRSPHPLVTNFQYLDAGGGAVLRLSACRFHYVDLIHRRHGKPERYVFALRAKPATGAVTAATTPSPTSLSTTAATMVAGTEDAVHHGRHLAEVMPLINVLATAYALRAIEAPHIRIKAELPACANPALFARLVDVLLEDGILVRRDGVLALGDETLPPIEELQRSLLSLSPSRVAELTLLARCGTSLPAILNDELEASAVLPPACNSLLDHLFETSPTWSRVNAMASASLDACIERWILRRPMRVLEIVPPKANLFESIGAYLQGRCEYTIAGSPEQPGAFDTGRHPLVRVAAIQLSDQPELTVKPGRSHTFDVVVVNNLLRISGKPN